MLDRRRRRRANINSTLGQRPMFAGYKVTVVREGARYGQRLKHDACVPSYQRKEWLFTKCMKFCEQKNNKISSKVHKSSVIGGV